MRIMCRLVTPSFTTKSRSAELNREISSYLPLSCCKGLASYSLLRDAIVIHRNRARFPVYSDMPVLAMLDVIVQEIEDRRCVVIISSVAIVSQPRLELSRILRRTYRFLPPSNPESGACTVY